jgi:hypothetical protein
MKCSFSLIFESNANLRYPTLGASVIECLGLTVGRTHIHFTSARVVIACLILSITGKIPLV